MTQTVCILGRQPALGLAELESLYGDKLLKPIGNSAVLIAIDPPQINFSRLGGTVKFCKLLTILDTTNWAEIQKFLEIAVLQNLQYMPEGKMKLGLSVYDLPVSIKQIQTTALTLKKVIKKTGRSVRVIPNTALALNSAQVLYNQLTSSLGWELIFIKDGNQTILAQNIAEQDINSYADRDQQRPKRDSHVGMLPPKLAQIIINLANNQNPIPLIGCSPSQSTTLTTKKETSAGLGLPKITVLDPFCGTGVILQEALLMGYSAYGTDLEPKMVEYSNQNINWLMDKLGLSKIVHSQDQSVQEKTVLSADEISVSPSIKEKLSVTEISQPGDKKILSKPNEYKPVSPIFKFEIGDATNYNWQNFDFIASEIYLGQPLASMPNIDTLQKIAQNTHIITKKFLQNLASQTKPGLRICLAVPAWKTASGFKHLKTLDNLSELGYNRISLVHVSNDKLIYHRDGQFVARELVILIRK